MTIFLPALSDNTSPPLCIPVAILTDNDVESDEEFVVEAAFEDGVIPNSASVTVVITGM
jgi:hypothetical protein